MDVLIIVVGFLALLHFIYEGIVAPSLRIKLRNDMFKLRDELRHLHRDEEKCNRQAFDITHGGINQYINRLHMVNFELMARFRRAYRDRTFREEVERRKAILDACKSEDLQGIVGRANQRIEAALAVNTGMWFVYLVPLALIGLCVKAVSARVHRYMSRLFAVSEIGTKRLVSENIDVALA